MITTKITITPYLAEYIIGKYNHCNKGEVKIPDTTDLYHVIWEYMSRRPENVSVVSGILTSPLLQWLYFPIIYSAK